MDKYECAWAAGIIDGEGTFSVWHHQERSWHIRLSVPQASNDLNPPLMLLRLQALFYGTTLPKKTTENRKPMWVWTIQNRDGVQAAAESMWPWLGPEKRAQFEKGWAKVTFINKSPSPKVGTLCAACGKETVAAPSARRRYCSMSCAKSQRSRNSATGHYE